MDLIYHGGFQDQEPPFFIEFLQEAFFLGSIIFWWANKE
jgi:hypothetical protein